MLTLLVGFDYRLGGWGHKRSKSWLRNIWMVPNESLLSDEACEDKNQQCSSWAERGFCIKNSAYMLPNCAKSCGECGSGKNLKYFKGCF